MGANKGFWKTIRHLRQPIGGSITRGQRAQLKLVDASVFMHRLHYRNPQLAWKVFTADPKKCSDCVAIVEEYARLLVADIRRLVDGTPTYWLMTWLTPFTWL